MKILSVLLTMSSLFGVPEPDPGDIARAASVIQAGVRLGNQRQETLPPPPAQTELPQLPHPCSLVWYVNAMPFGWHKMDVAMEAYRLVAACDGWTHAEIAAWEPFAYDVIFKESGGCWNARGGDVFVLGTCSQYVRRGSAEDSGFAQLTSSIWGRGGTLCIVEGYCSGAQVRSSPWASMDAAVKTFRLYGSQPWCYNDYARRYHNCQLVSSSLRPGA